ncbi:MAG: low molecular weight phosphatase family protein [Patescibacteria group bacterium]
MRVLFICRGNVGRSQVAEVIFNKLAKGKHLAVSAGTIVINPEGKSQDGVTLKDVPGAEKVLTALSEIGIDASENKRSQLSPEMLDTADKVIVMAEKDTIPDYLSKNSEFTYWELKDPKKESLEFMRDIRDQIQVLVKELINTLS